MGILDDITPEAGEIWLLADGNTRGRRVSGSVDHMNMVYVISEPGYLRDGEFLPDSASDFTFTRRSVFLKEFVKFVPEPEFKPGDILTDKTRTHLFMYVNEGYMKRLSPIGVRMADPEMYVGTYGPLIHLHVGSSDMTFNVLECLRNN